MTEYAKLVLAEATCHTIEIREKATGKEGIANTCAEGVELFYGADDGSDDKTVSAEEFSRDFEITAMISAYNRHAHLPENGLKYSPIFGGYFTHNYRVQAWTYPESDGNMHTTKAKGEHHHEEQRQDLPPAGDHHT